MEILFPALAVAVAAFCVWLGVRIVNRRERWAMWTAACLLVLLVIYPLSAGPAMWFDVKLSSRYRSPQWFRATIGQLYVPLVTALGHGPDWLEELWSDYVGWWIESAQPKFSEPLE